MGQTVPFPNGTRHYYLAPAIGPKAHTPDGARNQPSQYPKFRYTKHTTHYRFDPDTYKGKDSLETLLKDVRSSLKGAKLLNNRLAERSNYSMQELTCSFHMVVKEKPIYKDNTFMKAGTKYETNKRLGKDLFP